MHRSLDFSNVTNYDLQIGENSLVIKIKQGDLVTNINIGQNHQASSAIVLAAKKAPQRRRTSNWRPGEAKLNETQVREIRQLWPDTLKESGTKTRATHVLAQIYDCSSANIGLIVDRKTWTHLA